MPIDCGPGMGLSAFGSVRGGPRQSSLNAVLDNKNKPGKKKPGLFRGIGSMFRYVTQVTSYKFEVIVLWESTSLLASIYPHLWKTQISQM
jgi:hypothetical protein